MKLTVEQKLNILFISLIILASTIIVLSIVILKSKQNANPETKTEIVWLPNKFDLATVSRLKKSCGIPEHKSFSDNDLKIISVENRVKAAIDSLDNRIEQRRKAKIEQLVAEGKWSN